jgi:hypothetical protein
MGTLVGRKFYENERHHLDYITPVFALDANITIVVNTLS